MTIREVMEQIAYCNNCVATKDFPGDLTKKRIRQLLIEDGWTITYTKDLCPKCNPDPDASSGSPTSESQQVPEGERYRCYQCGLVVTEIPKWSLNECPRDKDQHRFERTTENPDRKGEVGA